MEYTRLPKLSNTYPTFLNYKSNGVGKVQLFGKYADKNKIDFNIPSIDKINFVDNTNFRFILAIFKTYNDTTPVYYTSDSYYKDLEASTIENNPYFLLNTFKNENIVSFVCEDAIKLYTDFKPIEKKSFIDVRQSLFIKGNGDIDYDNLVRYIDWFVDKPSPLDDPNFGVLQSEVVAGWDILNGNYVTGELTTGVSGSFGIGAQLVITTDVNTSDAEKNLKLEQDKRDAIAKKISLLEDAVAKETGFQYDKGPFGIGWKRAFTTVNETPYQSNSNFDFTKSVKINQLKDVLRADINSKYIEKKAADASVQSALDNLNDLKNKANELKNTAEDLKNKANDLLGKIPKIPKIPALPKIPKLPNSLGELKGLLPTIPAIPELPKLPSLPKIPSLKFPPLPKFKPKKPKEPKKFKKGKGLKGLQDQANQLQSAAGDLQNQAAGAISSAQNAAASAQSAVASAQLTIQNSVSTLQNSAQSAVSSIQNTVSSTVSSIQTEAQNAIANIPKPKI